MDPKINQVLSEIYYTPGGFQSAKNLYAKARKQVRLELKQVQEWLAQQTSQSIFTRSTVKHFMPITANRDSPFQRVQMDIMFPQSMRQDQGYTCALILVDTFSRYVLAYLLVNNDETQVVNAFEQALKDMNDVLNVFPPLEVDCDGEGAFNSEGFQNVLSANNIKLNQSYSGDHHHLAFVDRIIRTLRTKISQYNAAFDNTEWVDPLKAFVYSYNGQKNSSMNLSPKQILDAMYEEDGLKVVDRAQLKDKSRIQRLRGKVKTEPWFNRTIKVGDMVRVPMIDKSENRFADKRFTKLSAGRWESQPVKVTDIENGVFYRVDRYPNLKFRKYELLPVTESRHAPSVQIGQQLRRTEQLQTIRKNNRVNRELKQLDAPPVPQLEPVAFAEPSRRASSRARKPTDFGPLLSDRFLV